MCICVRLQDPNEKPLRDDPKYFKKACAALLKKLESGQEVTRRMLEEETQRFFRRDYKAWNKRVHAKKKARARDGKDQKLELTDLGFGALNVETRSSPPPLENSWQRDTLLVDTLLNSDMASGKTFGEEVVKQMNEVRDEVMEADDSDSDDDF